MKKILFIIRDFKQGGIPRCLQSLLQVMDPSKFEIDLLCLYQKGPYRGEMKNCNVIPQDMLLFHLLSFGKNISFVKSPVTFLFKALNILAGKIFQKNLLQRKIENIAKSLSSRYDVVIAYSEGICAQIAQSIVCDKKLVWIHNDYAFECARADKGTDFKCFNSIVCVSKATEKSFVSAFPDMKERVCTVYNIINHDFIIQLSLNSTPVEFDDNVFNIVSVGRICYQKNFRIIPKILSAIPHDKRNKLKWYIIGDGPTEEVEIVKSEIKRYGVENNCLLLGRRDNPYPYLKKANLFVLTSLYESYPTVINEALVLGTPILSINIPPAYEMLDSKFIASEEDMPLRIIDEMTEDGSFRNFKIDASAHNASVISKMVDLFEK